MTSSPLPLDKYFSYAVASTHRKLHVNLNKQLNSYGIQVETWRVLETLDQTNNLTMSDLAKVVLMNPPALTKMVDRMVSDGLVQRQISREDQRQVTLVLTNIGLDLVQNVRQPAIHQNAKVVEQLGQEKVALIHEALESLNKLL